MTATVENEHSAKHTSSYRLTAAQAIIRYLIAQKVELFDGTVAPLCGGIWGIFGHGNVGGIGEALSEMQDKIPYFRGHNEQGMAHTAIAYAKANRARQMMGVTTSIGPGATNLVTAAALAHINRLPVLFLPGDNFASRYPDPVLQQLETEHSPLASVNDTLAPVSRFFDRITRPEQLLYALPFAIQTLIDPVRRGPVTLALPQDVQAERYTYPAHFFQETIHYLHRLRPDIQALKRAAKTLAQAKKPLIIAGGGVHYSGAEKTLQNFVETHRIPLAETQAGKGSLPWSHPLNLGAIGVTGSSAANALAKQADLILCVGTRLSDFTTASKSLFHHSETEFIHLNVAPFDTNKGKGIPLIGDALVTLEELSRAASDYKTSSSTHQIIAEEKAKWELEHQSVTKGSSKSLPTDTEVLAVVNRVLSPEDIVVCSAGGLPGELHKHWEASDPVGYHLEYGYSCMGYEVAGGLGAKMAHPNREVCVLVGDGSYLMLHTELLTSVQLGYKIQVVLLDNGGFGCINRLQKSLGGKPFGNLFPERGVDFVQNGASYGCLAQKAHSLNELENFLILNRKEKRSCITVIDTDPETGSPGHAKWDVPIAKES